MFSYTFKEVIFFVVVFLLLGLSGMGSAQAAYGGKLSPKFATIVSSIIFTMALLGLFYLFKFNDCKDGYTNSLFHVSPARQCSGGLYLHTGNDPRSKMCRKLLTNQKGCQAIENVNCPSGFHGRNVNFEFTPDSGPNWQNERCDGDNKPQPSPSHY